MILHFSHIGLTDGRTFIDHLLLVGSGMERSGECRPAGRFSRHRA
jgi:hypothetical protein